MFEPIDMPVKAALKFLFQRAEFFGTGMRNTNTARGSFGIMA